MAEDSYWQLDKEYYPIAASHDLIVRVIEYESITRTVLSEDGTASDVKEAVASKVHEFKVQRETLAANSAYFKATLGEKIDLHGDDPGSIEVWLKILHGCDVSTTLTSTTLKGVWDMLATAYRYEFDPKLPAAKTWFKAWYDANKHKDGNPFYFEDCQSLLFPCHSFDYAEAFQRATKYLVYNATGHITERKPEGFKGDHLRLDSNVIQQLNAARGRLKTILHRKLYDPIDKLLKRTNCKCKAETLYAYEFALSNTGAWPLETAFLRSSVNEIMRYLDNFQVEQDQMSKMCGDCTFNFRQAVFYATKDCRKSFDGLCLDCMDASKPKLSSNDEDYWKHDNLGVDWDDGCRVSHDQPTWYFSFMGRRGKMMEWNRNKSGGGRGGRGGYGRGGHHGVEDVANGVGDLDTSA